MNSCWPIFVASLSLSCVGAFGVDAPNTRVKPLGPEVDLTLKDATSRHGYLLSFTNGVITVELESGERLVKDGSDITSLHFIAKIQPLTARQTEISNLEMAKLSEFRVQERKSGLSKSDEAEYHRLRKKVGIHIEALEREIPDVRTSDEAREYLQEIVRNYAHFGVQAVEIKSAVKQAVESIKNEQVKKSVIAYQETVIHNMEERMLKPKAMDRKPFLFPPTPAPQIKNDKPTAPSTTKSGEKPPPAL